MSVPTPTGVLQGVAAFNWDGAVWQPAGRAGPSVATPTGNLQGVAAFTGGPSWAPVGRAGPGVPTPTGVLDGVAVYIWSGSQWTPPGGTETVPTPTGGLRGVAAFDWDGTAWQPAAQARSSVPTPYGVLDGVARFNWTGSAWAATGAPSLSLDFMTPGLLDPRITFTRASTATYTDQNGTIQTAATNAPRWDYDPVTHALRGLLIEEARTNLLLNSMAPGTQSVTVTAQAYTLSFYGTGTITKSGAATGALVGTGVGQRVSQTFTPTAGTVTCTVTGSVVNAQLEAGGFATSPIITSAAPAARAADTCYIPVASWYNAPAWSLFYEIYADRADALIGGISTTNFSDAAYIGLPYFLAEAGTAYNSATISAGTIVKACANLSNAGLSIKLATNGQVGPGVAIATPLGAGTRLTIGSDPWSMSVFANSHIRRVTFWPRVLSDAEMQSVTT
jgi:hypothetical protein